jgi:2-keto-4-pentenoate hydratase/2-oxohepta-3-ene-1,7-dioic acid hydratase in catechol pathway
MKLVTYSNSDTSAIGALLEDSICPFTNDSSLPNEMKAFLEGGEVNMNKATDLLEKAENLIPVDSVTLLSPILNPQKILAIGLNYADHVKESGMETPKIPMVFNKQSSSVTGHNGVIHLPRASEALDYEAEMAFVIGKQCRHVSKDEAASVIAGITICNDVSVRDWQLAVPTFTMGKSFDTHCPLGPCLVTMDEIGDPHNLDIKLFLNGEEKQNSNTKELVFNCYDLIEHLSTAFTLMPGRCCSYWNSRWCIGRRSHGRRASWLQEGDEIKIELEKVGTLSNKVVKEPDSTKFIA